MLYGWKEVNSENRRKKCAVSTRLECPRQKIVIIICQKHGRKKKMYKFTEEVEIDVAIIAMWLIL